MVCSKRGPDWPAGRGCWFVDHVAAWFGDWGTTTGTGCAAAGTAALEDAEEDKRVNAERRRAAAARRVDSMLWCVRAAVEDGGSVGSAGAGIG